MDKENNKTIKINILLFIGSIIFVFLTIYSLQFGYSFVGTIIACLPFWLITIFDIKYDVVPFLNLEIKYAKGGKKYWLLFNRKDN